MKLHSHADLMIFKIKVDKILVFLIRTQVEFKSLSELR